MLAWRGGRRRLIREQKARRKLEGVFNAAAKNSKPAPRRRRPATVEALGEQFSDLRTRSTPNERNISAEIHRNNEGAPTAAAAAAHASHQADDYFGTLPAFPSMSLAGRSGISLDILAIQGPSHHHLKTVFEASGMLAEIEEILNENSLEMNPSRPLNPAAASTGAAPFLVSIVFDKRNAEKHAQTSQSYKKDNNDYENSDMHPMSLEL